MKKYTSLIVIILLGLLLRLYHLTSISLWHDEAFSALLIKYSWGEMFYRIGLDVHPPLYYVALRFWSYVAGTSLLSLRGFSVLFGVLVIPLVYGLVHTVFKNRTAATWSALLVAVNPFFIYYVTEARMYTFGAALALGAAYALIKALQNQSTGNKPWPYYTVFILLGSGMMYTHYYLFFTLAAFGLFALVYLYHQHRLNFKAYKYFALSVIIIALLYIPWTPTFLFQLKQVEGGYWIPPIDKWSIPSTLWQMLTGHAIDIYKNNATVIAIVAVTLVLIIFYQIIKRQLSTEKYLLIFSILAPFFGSILFWLLALAQGKDSSVFLVRYFVFTVPFLSALIALWINQSSQRQLAKFIIICYTLMCTWYAYSYWTDLRIETKPGMTALAHALTKQARPGDHIYIGSSFEYFNFKYYANCTADAVAVPAIAGICPKLYSGGITDVTNLPHYAGTAILTNEDLLPDFSQETKANDTIWLIWTNGFGGTKPNVPPSWLQINEQKFDEVRPYVGTTLYLDQYQVQ